MSESAKLEFAYGDDTVFHRQLIVAAIRGAVLAEREECARLCEARQSRFGVQSRKQLGWLVAAIRARPAP